MKFRRMETGKMLSGSPIVEEVSEEFELLGAICDYEPEWRKNDAGGTSHYSYGGQSCYVPLLFIKSPEGQILAYSLNRHFVDSFTIPNPIPKEWGTPGTKFRFTRDSRIVWESKPIPEF